MGFRWRLLISYAVVVVVTLLLGMLLFGLIVGQIQRDATKQATERLRTISDKVSEDIATFRPVRPTLNDYQQALARFSDFLDVRLLLVDSRGRVWADTETNANSALNQILPNVKLVPRNNQAYQSNIVIHDTNYFYYARPGPPIRGGTAQVEARRVSFATAPPDNQTLVDFETDLWLAVPEATLNAGWDEVGKGLLLAGAIALAVSIGLALLIARSITRPLLRMTRASVAIAQGNYDEQLPVQGQDEMGRLAQSFNQMAREVSRSQQTMRDFVANVSHELKTPLTSIQGFSQAVIEGVAEDPAEIKHSAEVVYSEAARMRRLVDELLDLSRIESGQVEFTRRELDLRQLLERVVMRLGPLATSKNLSFQHRIDDLPELNIMGDADRLEQVLTNIMDNAIKYSRENSPLWVEVKTGQSLPVASAGLNGPEPSEHNRSAKPGRPGNYINVAIGNIGPVIPAEELPRIFERFYKLDRSRKRRGESTGLGLAIAKELVEAHHGTITVTSYPLGEGQGLPGDGYTVFTIYLPHSPTHQPTTNLVPNLLKR